MKELDMKRLFLCTSLLLLVGMTSNSRLYAQEDPLDRALNYVPYSDFPYKDLDTGAKLASIGHDARFLGKIYSDMQRKKVWILHRILIWLQLFICRSPCRISLSLVQSLMVVSVPIGQTSYSFEIGEGRFVQPWNAVSHSISKSLSSMNFAKWEK